MELVEFKGGVIVPGFFYTRERNAKSYKSAKKQ
jgi:hypothetical protein